MALDTGMSVGEGMSREIPTRTLESTEVALHDGDHRYEVHSCESTTEQSERPLVVYFGLGTTALTGVGQMYLREFVGGANRPVITLHPLTSHWKDAQDRANSDAEYLMNLEGEVDILGNSAGGALASRVAAAMGDRAKHLITASPVGMHEGLFHYLRGIPGHFIDGIRETDAVRQQGVNVAELGKRASNLFSLAHARETMWDIRYTVGDSLSEAVESLNGETKWMSLVGSGDRFSDYRRLLSLVRSRNQQHPGSSSIHIAGGHGHMWAADRAFLAEFIDKASQVKR